jgi:hypothetical protein
MSLDEELAMWPASQPKEWMPKTIGFVQQRNNEGLLKGTTSYPSRVDTYFDRKYADQSWLNLKLNIDSICEHRLELLSQMSSRPLKLHLQMFQLIA